MLCSIQIYMLLTYYCSDSSEGQYVLHCCALGQMCGHCDIDVVEGRLRLIIVRFGDRRYILHY